MSNNHSQPLKDAVEVLESMLEIVPHKHHSDFIDDLGAAARRLANGRSSDWATTFKEDFPQLASFDFDKAESYLKKLQILEVRLLTNRLHDISANAAAELTPVVTVGGEPQSPASTLGMESRTESRKSPDFESVTGSLETISLSTEKGTVVSQASSKFVNENPVTVNKQSRITPEELASHYVEDDEKKSESSSSSK